MTNWHDRARYVGHLVATLSLAAMCFVLFVNYDRLPSIKLTFSSTLSLLEMLVIYCLAAIPASLSWHVLNRKLLPHWSYGQSFSVWSISQVGKYLPGSVAHHLARVAYVKSDSNKIAGAMAIQFYEMILAIPASAFVTLSIMLCFDVQLAFVVRLSMIVLVVLFCFVSKFVLIVLLFLLIRY